MTTATASNMADYMEAQARHQNIEPPQGYGYKADIALGWGFFLEEGTGCKVLEKPIMIPSGSTAIQGYMIIYAYCQQAGVVSILEGQIPPHLPGSRKEPKEFRSLESIAENFGAKDPKKAAASADYCVPFRIPSELVEQVDTPGRDIWMMNFANDKVSPFLQWAKSGTVEKVKLALADISSDTVDDQGVSALMMAAMGGWEETCQALLDKGASVNMAEPNGHRTPLMFAAQGGHANAVTVLLRAGADPNMVDTEGCNSLMWASVAGQVEVVKMLVPGTKLDAVNKEGLTASQLADKMKHATVVAALA